MEQPRLKINEEEIGLRDLGDNLFEPKNLTILKNTIEGKGLEEKKFFVERPTPLQEPPEYHKIKSFCFVTTSNIKEEAGILLKSLREFHQEPVYVICDKETRIYLAKEKINENVFFRTSAEQEHLDAIQKKVFDEHSCVANKIHNAPAILKKMEVMDFALENEENTFFLDSDIIVLDNLQEYFTSSIVLSPHFYSGRNMTKGFEFGFYNAGYLFCAEKGFPKFWRHIYLTNSTFFEQEGMNRISDYYNIQTFGEEHNVGFWRSGVLPENPKSVHCHIADDLYETNRTESLIELNKQIKDYAIGKSKNQPKINSYVRKFYNPEAPQKIAFVHFGKCAGSYMRFYMKDNFLKPLNYNNIDSWLPSLRHMNRDWNDEELNGFINSAEEKMFIHNHHFGWNEKMIKIANEHGFLTFCFIRNPKDILCSLYCWGRERIAGGEQIPINDPDGKKFKEGEGFDSVFSTSAMDLSLDEFINVFTNSENSGGCGSVWHLPDWIDEVEYVAEFNDKNFAHFLNKYFQHYYVPRQKINISSNKGYKYYYDKGLISEETHEMLNNHPEVLRYKNYLD